MPVQNSRMITDSSLQNQPAKKQSQHKSAALALVFVASFSTASLNALPIVNGGFEDTSSSTPITGIANGQQLSDLQSGSGNTSWDVFTAIPGWQSDSGRGIEIQTNATLGTIDANSGLHYVELDSHTTDTTNSNMYQLVTLDPGSYQLSFYYSPRESNSGTNGIAYSVGSLLSGSATGPGGSLGSSVSSWTLITETFNVTTAGNYRLEFQAIEIDDSLGGLIDDVSIKAVPIPAAAWLFGTGLIALAGLKRRKS